MLPSDLPPICFVASLKLGEFLVPDHRLEKLQTCLDLVLRLRRHLCIGQIPIDCIAKRRTGLLLRTAEAGHLR
jgi:hypothetical protein